MYKIIDSASIFSICITSISSIIQFLKFISKHVEPLHDNHDYLLKP